MVSEKLKTLPQTSGVYLFKDTRGRVLYIGKAARLKARVSAYFGGLSGERPLIARMIPKIADVDVIETPSEVEALFLESELIKRRKPPFNTEWKDEKNFLYVKIDREKPFPTVELVRRPLDDTARYFGPYTDAGALRRALRLLRKIFPYSTHRNPSALRRACLDYHLGLCPGPEIGALSPVEYRTTIRRLTQFFEGKYTKLALELEKDMKRAAAAREFEKAAVLRDRVFNLRALGRRVIFGNEESFALEADDSLTELARVLRLANLPRRIEAFDISEMHGKESVGSMIVFIDGLPRREEYRKFSIRTVKGIDDFRKMEEVVRRRFTAYRKKAGAFGILPDLVLVDGGKGQLSFAVKALGEVGLTIPAVGLAKRFEEVIQQTYNPRLKVNTFRTHRFPEHSAALHLLQRIRDEAHRFAVTYHHLLTQKKSVYSKLDTVPGIGPARRKRLLKTFGSVAGIKAASESELVAVLGSKALARVIKETL